MPWLHWLTFHLVWKLRWWSRFANGPINFDQFYVGSSYKKNMHKIRYNNAAIYYINVHLNIVFDFKVYRLSCKRSCPHYQCCLEIWYNILCNMHKNNTQVSAISTKGLGKSTGTRVGIIVIIAFGHGHVIKPDNIKVPNEFLMADFTTPI